MKYIYEVVIRPEEEGGYTAFLPDFDSNVGGGCTVEEAIAEGYGGLEVLIGTYVSEEDLTLPESRLNYRAKAGEKSFALMLELTDEDIERMGYFTIQEAAEELNISSSRVHQLFTNGQLEGMVSESGERLVSIESVNERRLNPPATGRPRKAMRT